MRFLDPKLPGDFTDFLLEHPIPRFQKIMLLDLPVEVLENITGKCDSESLSHLYTTCRRLRLIALADVYTVRSFSCALPLPHHSNEV